MGLSGAPSWAQLLPEVQAQQEAEAAAPLIDEIQVLGLSSMSRVALLFRLEIAEGQPYDAAKIRRNFRSLWDLGVLEDISVEVENSPKGGKAIIIKVRERPKIARVEFEENSVLTQTEIEDELSRRGVQLKENRPIDRGEVARAQSAVRDLLASRGYLGSKVEADVRRVTETARSVTFRITPGGKTRIRKIDFVGNELYSDRQLIKALELTKPRRWYYPWSSKSLYFQPKWDQDVGNLRALYEDRGYLDVSIAPPVVEVRTKDGELVEPEEAQIVVRDPEPVEMPAPPEFPDDISERKRRKLQARYEKKLEKAEKKQRKRERAAIKEQSKKLVHLTVRVSEGQPYTLGQVTFSGKELTDDERARLRGLILLREGDVFNKGLIDLGVSQITRSFENSGYLYANIVSNPQRQPDNLIADVDIAINEGKSYKIGTIEFGGNQRTLDAVLRREVPLGETSTFSRDLLDLGTRKINQLGYWRATEEPTIEPNDEDQTVDITIVGEEQGRNEIQVGGGFSGLDGAFFNGVYSTRNFLGRGQTLSTSIQVGGRRSTYQISFQEPWFLNRPILLGANIFRREIDFTSSLTSSSTGFGVQVGRRLGRFGLVNVGYNFERVDSDSFVTDDAGQSIQVNTSTTLSSITPVYVYRTIDNPFRPRRGEQLRASVQVAGGPVGGDSSFLRPRLEMTAYRPFGRSVIFAQNLELSYALPFGDGDVSNSSIGNLPRFQRLFLGGDIIGPRIFDNRSVVPRRDVIIVDGNFVVIDTDLNGEPFVPGETSVVRQVEVGGNRSFLYQAELVFPVNEQIDIVGFVDAGDVFFEDQALGFETTRISAGAELRFNLPIFPVPLRLIYGVPVRKLETDDTNTFSFSVGRAF